MAKTVVRPEGTVPLMGQSNSKCCWHTCYKMLYGWDGQDTGEVDRRIPNPGKKGTPTEDGLKPSQFKWACAKMGLSGYPAKALKKRDKMAWILKKCGPIWTTGKFIPTRLHTVVIAGMRWEPLEVLIHDPWPNWPMGSADWLLFSWWSKLVCTDAYSCQVWW